MEGHLTTRLKGKTAIVTGAGQGIGLEICRTLLLDGCRVILNEIDPALAASASAKLAGLGDHVIISGDAGQTAIIQNMIDTAVTHFGGLDIVIANAGITLFGDFLSYPEADMRRVLDLNAAGTFLLAQAAARQMVSQGTGGSLLFMSSVVGHQAHKGLAAYAMTKAALEMLAKNLVIELSGYGINVNTVAPGATLTERTLEDANYTAIWSEITPMRRPATVADIAAAARFLVSDEARHITGQSLIIDGGWTSVSPNPY
jgi:NAD(P)-dependent dehydrogenase (short-subunit alcohol dehydrogenase family)